MNKEQQVNDIIFEALFRQAVIDDFDEKLDSMPTKEQLSKLYSFSPEFEIRMKKLFTKDRRRSFIRTGIFYTRKVASIIIIVLGLIFGTLLFNTEVRATVGKVFVEWYEKFTSFTYRDEETINEKKDWSLKYLPEGYVGESYEVLGRITNIEFTNNKGDKIRFSYYSEESITTISVDNENHEIDSYVILGNEAFTATATDNRFDNGIIWNADGHTFNLWGKIPIAELKKIAESMSENK